MGAASTRCAHASRRERAGNGCAPLGRRLASRPARRHRHPHPPVPWVPHPPTSPRSLTRSDKGACRRPAVAPPSRGTSLYGQTDAVYVVAVAAWPSLVPPGPPRPRLTRPTGPPGAAAAALPPTRPRSGRVPRAERGAPPPHRHGHGRRRRTASRWRGCCRRASPAHGVVRIPRLTGGGAATPMPRVPPWSPPVSIAYGTGVQEWVATVCQQRGRPRGDGGGVERWSGWGRN